MRMWQDTCTPNLSVNFKALVAEDVKLSSKARMEIGAFKASLQDVYNMTVMLCAAGKSSHCTPSVCHNGSSSLQGLHCSACRLPPKFPGLTTWMSTDAWGVQLLCLEFMRSVLVAAQLCLHLDFPEPFCGVRSLPCTTTSQILELGPLGDACRVCECHNLPLHEPGAGEMSRSACKCLMAIVICGQYSEPTMLDIL